MLICKIMSNTKPFTLTFTCFALLYARLCKCFVSGRLSNLPNILKQLVLPSVQCNTNNSHSGQSTKTVNPWLHDDFFLNQTCYKMCIIEDQKLDMWWWCREVRTMACTCNRSFLFKAMISCSCFQPKSNDASSRSKSIVSISIHNISIRNKPIIQ